MAFQPLKRVSFQDVRTYVLGNSQTLAIGDSVVPGATTHAGAVVTGASTTSIILGVIRAIVNPLGKPLEVTSQVAASNNETVGLIAAEIIPSYLDIEYLADMSQATGTTTSSALMGYFNMGSTHGQLDETSYGAFTTQKQFWSFGSTGINPGATTTSTVTGKWASTFTL